MGPTPQQIEHYVRVFRDERVSEYCETFWWTVVRPRRGRLSPEDVVCRLNGKPATLATARPGDVEYDDAQVFVEPRGDAVVVSGSGLIHTWEDVILRLSRDADVHGTFWLINNYSELYHAADGVMVTRLDVLDPKSREGTDPDALIDHLDALIAQSDEADPALDWPTAMATVESLTGERLTADWFDRPHLLARIGD